MSLDVNAPSEYELLLTGRDLYSIIRKNPGLKDRIEPYKVVVPDAGTPQVARQLLFWYRKDEKERRERIAKSHLEWGEKMKHKHIFIK